MSQLCDVCEKPSQQMCEKCMHSIYCSKKCQISDRDEHQKVCSFIASDYDADTDRQPGNDFKSSSAKKKSFASTDRKRYKDARQKLLNRQKQEMRELRLKQKEDIKSFDNHWRSAPVIGIQNK